MQPESADPSKLAFWRQRLEEQTIIAAVRAHPDQARRIFGAVPVMRENVFQLAVILAARQILTRPEGNTPEDPFDGLGERGKQLHAELQTALCELPEEWREVADEFLGSKNQQKILREWARRLIKDATGFDA